MNLNGWQIDQGTATATLYYQDEKESRNTIVRNTIVLFVKWETNPYAYSENPENSAAQYDENSRQNNPANPAYSATITLNAVPHAKALFMPEHVADNNLPMLASALTPEDVLKFIRLPLASQYILERPPTDQDNQVRANFHSPEELCTWPATPNNQEFTEAEQYMQFQLPEMDHNQFIKKYANTANTANPLFCNTANLMDARDSYQYMQWAAQEFQDKHRPDQTEINLIVRIAAKGESETTIGFGLAKITNNPNAPIIRAFHRLQRHPRWTGFCTALPYVKGTTALVFESKILTGLPGVVAAYSLDYSTKELKQQLAEPFPEGPPTDLMKLLEWHGALNCLWVPYQPRT